MEFVYIYIYSCDENDDDGGGSGGDGFIDGDCSFRCVFFIVLVQRSRASLIIPTVKNAVSVWRQMSSKSWSETSDQANKGDKKLSQKQYLFNNPNK